MAGKGGANLKIFKDEIAVSREVCQFVVNKAKAAIAEHGLFFIGVSGGSVAKFLCNGLDKDSTDWSKWRVFFCDERHVAFDDSECTYKYYKDNLMNKVPLSNQHVFADNPSVSVEEAAKLYEAKLREVFGDAGVPRFDVLMLGMGPDGHTCSLFPGHPLLKEENCWVAAIKDSPKPPPQRITLTYPVIQNAKCAVFTSCGAGKSEMVKRVIEGKEEPPLPAAQVRPHTGELVWFLDQGAANLLSKC